MDLDAPEMNFNVYAAPPLGETQHQRASEDTEQAGISRLNDAARSVAENLALLLGTLSNAFYRTAPDFPHEHDVEN
jgi:hypothetical protein